MAEMAEKEARTWGMLCHLSALAAVICPFGNIIGPLVVWLIKKEESPFVDEQGKESLNFQITMTIALTIAAILILAIIGIVLLPALLLANLIFIILASISANNGESYKYPYSIKFVK